jgi:hypothetical protein
MCAAQSMSIEAALATPNGVREQVMTSPSVMAAVPVIRLAVHRPRRMTRS